MPHDSDNQPLAFVGASVEAQHMRSEEAEKACALRS